MSSSRKSCFWRRLVVASVSSEMTSRSTIIVLSGAKGVYTSALSVVLSETLGWKRARFSDHIRAMASEQGENAEDTAVLQKIGQSLVRERPDEFVAAVLKMAGWNKGENLILDGLRHIEVFAELQRCVGDCADVRVVHLGIADRADRADRAKRSEGFSTEDFNTYALDETERQVEEAPAFANLELNGADPRGELSRTIINRFLPDFHAPAPEDAGETVFALEPMIVGTGLEVLAQDLIREATNFANEVPRGLAKPLAALVRAMNCYHSNRIEGRNAPLADIEFALNGNYERDSKKRSLQAEARAHIKVQRWIDEGGGLAGLPAASGQFLTTVHDRFLSEVPEPQWVSMRDGKAPKLVSPGAFRSELAEVGRHVPPSPGAVPRLMKRFEEVYGRLVSPESVVMAAAAAHHRLLWIHPFADGNGRVARLMSDVMLNRTLRTHNLWSVSRGLAHHEDRYKSLLQQCDQPRRGDLDGRGNLSEQVTIEFSTFFLRTCLEEVRFMRARMRLDELEHHIDRWVDAASSYGDQSARSARLHPAAGIILKAALHEGALSISRCQSLVGDGIEASVLIKQLEQHAVVRLSGDAVNFLLPIHRAERFLPGLFP